jgi:hypothetical protein
VAVGISYTEYYLNYAQFGMTAFSATSGTLRQVLLQEMGLSCLAMHSVHPRSLQLYAVSNDTVVARSASMTAGQGCTEPRTLQ